MILNKSWPLVIKICPNLIQVKLWKTMVLLKKDMSNDRDLFELSIIIFYNHQ